MVFVQKIGKWHLSAALAFLLLAGICDALWVSHNHKDTSSHQVNNAGQHNNSADSRPADTPNTPTGTTSGTTNKATPAPHKVENIPELGIQITVPEDIQDLTYQIGTVKLLNGHMATIAKFSTKTLTSLNASCSASFGPLGSLEKVAGDYPSNDKFAMLDYGTLVKQFATFYIASGTPNASCATTASVAETTAKLRNEFSASTSTIQQSK